MERIIRFLVLFLVSLFFGLAFTCLEPYPYKHSTIIWGSVSLIFLGIEIIPQSRRSRIAWNVYGLAVFGSCMLSNWWYWWGVKEKAWWYPPQPTIVEHFPNFRPESIDDAAVANFFLVLAFLVTVVFTVYSVVAYLKRRKIRSGV